MLGIDIGLPGFKLYGYNSMPSHTRKAYHKVQKKRKCVRPPRYVNGQQHTIPEMQAKWAKYYACKERSRISRKMRG